MVFAYSFVSTAPPTITFTQDASFLDVYKRQHLIVADHKKTQHHKAQYYSQSHILLCHG